MPRARRLSKGAKIAIAGGAAVLLVATAAGAWKLVASKSSRRADLVPYKVQLGSLSVTIVERGNLESAANSDITCKVKARTQGSTIATTIRDIIDDGSHVKKGDLLAQLDDSGLQDALKTSRISLDQDKAAWVTADENYKIQESQNASDIASAQVVLDLAIIDKKKYLEGDYLQSKHDIDGRTQIANANVEMRKDRVAWAQRMVRKKYLTESQAVAEKSLLDSDQIALNKVHEEMDVLEYYTKPRTVKDMQNKIDEARRALDRVKLQAVAKLAQADADRKAKQSVYQQELARYKEIEDEIAKCRIVSPQDGMVVYYVSDQQRMGSGAQQGIVAQGEPVREGQKIMQIPDMTKMLVTTKVHESLVSQVHEGQEAEIKVESFPRKIFHGHVKSVANTASPQDWFSGDVKLYMTKVSIEDYEEGLKPGMSAEVTIHAGGEVKDVLVVPVQAIIGSVDMGQKRKVFVITDGGPEEREIVVGMSNVKLAEVKSGLKEGETVVLNPKDLVGDVKQDVPTGPVSATKPEGQGGTGKGQAGQTPGGPGGPGATGAPAGPGKAGARRGGPGGDPSAAGGPPDPEQMKQRIAAMVQRFKAAPKEKRKEMLEKIPEQFRDGARQILRAEKVEIPD